MSYVDLISTDPRQVQASDKTPPPVPSSRSESRVLQLFAGRQSVKSSKSVFFDMSWKETSPGHFQRPLDSGELYFREIGEQGATQGREPRAVVACARFGHDISTHDAELALRHAWKTLRFLQPQLAAYMQGNSIHYEVLQPSELECWMRETFLVERVLTSDELLASSRRSSLPTLYYLPTTSEVLFCSPHWRIDAIGAISLINILFKSVAEPSPISFGNEVKNLSPGRDEAAGLSQDVSQEADDAATSLLMDYVSNLPSLGLPIELVNEFFGAPARIESRLSPAATASVVAACKKTSRTVTTAIHAALIIALQGLSCVSSERYTSWGTFSYRPYVDPKYANPSANPVAVMLCTLPISFIPSDFDETASLLQPFYRQLQNPFNSAALHSMLAPYSGKLAAMINQPLPRGVPQPTEPLVGSIGVLDRYLDGKYGQGAVEIKSFWLGEVVMTRQPLFYVWTWHGRMTFSMCYNEQFYTAKFMASFIERVMDGLLEALGVQRQ